jgi:hypothetical protein
MSISTGGCAISTTYGKTCLENINWILKIGKKKLIMGKPTS